MKRSHIITLVLTLLAGVFIGWMVKPSVKSEIQDSHANHSDSIQEQKAEIWTCSMDPQVRQPEPGKCPICGMDLIPLEAGGMDDNPAEIRMSPSAMQLANIQTMLVGTGNAHKEIRTNGKVQADERQIFSQSTHIEGRVEELNINFTGEMIQSGQKIGSIYSPELVTAQEELFAALKIRDVQPALYEAAKQKLKNWKLTDTQIDRIVSGDRIQESFPILSDVTGTVMERKVNLGDYVMRGMPLYEVVDLSKVWVLFDIYENDMPWVKIGSRVDFTIQSLPGEQFSGRITFIEPIIDPISRVSKARVEISNAKGVLKPEMFAVGVIKTSIGGGKDKIVVPKSAVMWTGEKSVVYTKMVDDIGVKFALREVTLGPLTGDGYVIRKGLELGEEIAVSGTFAIDAAAQLAGKYSMMNPDGNRMSTGQDHGNSSTSKSSKAITTKISPEAKEAVKKLFDPYFKLKDALVEADFDGAALHVRAMESELNTIDMNLFEGPSHAVWMQHSKKMEEVLKILVAVKNIDAARIQFKPLSAEMVGLAKAFGPFDNTIYIQYCPMADNNTGADWLSTDKQIRNPYFGDKMLKCGKVVAEIAIP